MAPRRRIVYVAPAAYPFQYPAPEHAAQRPQSPEPLTHLPPLPETPPQGAQMTHNVQDVQSIAACSETPSHPEHMQDDVPYSEQIASPTEKSASSALGQTTIPEHMQEDIPHSAQPPTSAGTFSYMGGSRMTPESPVRPIYTSIFKNTGEPLGTAAIIGNRAIVNHIRVDDNLSDLPRRPASPETPANSLEKAYFDLLQQYDRDKTAYLFHICSFRERITHMEERIFGLNAELQTMYNELAILTRNAL